MHTIGEFYELLHELSRRLNDLGEHATILLFGGGALAMRYGARDRTKDLDVAFQQENKNIVKEMAAGISADRGIEQDWINDEGIGSVTKEILADATTYLELPGLTVLSPSKEALLAMKVCSMRVEQEYPDLDDIRFLLRELFIKDVKTVFDITEKFRPDFQRYLTPKHQYTIEILVDEITYQPRQHHSFEDLKAEAIKRTDAFVAPSEQNGQTKGGVER